MRTRAIAALLALALAAGAVAVAVAVLARASGGGEAYRGSRPPPGVMLPDFALRDDGGEAVSREELRGKVVLVTFLESECEQACPTIAWQLARAVDRLSPAQRREVAAIAVSTHPHDDTPANVRAFLRKQRADERISYLVGSERELRPLWEEFAVLSALDSGNADTHSASVRVYDRRGEWVSTLHPGIDLTPANVVHDALLAAGR